MDTRIFHLGPGLGAEHGNLFLGPFLFLSGGAYQASNGHPFEGSVELVVVPGPDFFLNGDKFSLVPHSYYVLAYVVG